MSNFLPREVLPVFEDVQQSRETRKKLINHQTINEMIKPYTHDCTCTRPPRMHRRRTDRENIK